MIRRLKRWLATIIREELTSATAEIAALRVELTAVRAELKEHEADYAKRLNTYANDVITSVKDHGEERSESVKAHVEAAVIDSQTRVQNSHDELKDYIYQEILKRYDTLVRDAAAAARVMDSAKIAMAICDYCHLPKRRFSTSRIDGKIVCSDCAAKGQN